MRKLFVFLFVFFGFAFQVAAQTPTPTPPSSLLTHLSISGTATGVMGVGNQGATILAADFQITKTVGVEYQQIMVPSSANSFDIGAITYTRPLSQVLGKNITSKLLFDVTGWDVTAFAGAGRIVSNGKHAAETAGIRLSCPLNSNVTFQMLSAQWLHGPQTNGLITSPSTAAISSGLKISF